MSAYSPGDTTSIHHKFLKGGHYCRTGQYSASINDGGGKQMALRCAAGWNNNKYDII